MGIVAEGIPQGEPWLGDGLLGERNRSTLRTGSKGQLVLAKFLGIYRHRLAFFLFKDRLSCSPGSPQILYKAEDVLKFLILLPPPLLGSQALPTMA